MVYPKFTMVYVSNFSMCIIFPASYCLKAELPLAFTCLFTAKLYISYVCYRTLVVFSICCKKRIKEWHVATKLQATFFPWLGNYQSLQNMGNNKNSEYFLITKKVFICKKRSRVTLSGDYT